MSRSYKKHPVSKESSSKTNKKLSNKRIRKYPNISNGKSYKKVFNSYDICDFIFPDHNNTALDKFCDGDKRKYHKYYLNK